MCEPFKTSLIVSNLMDRRIAKLPMVKVYAIAKLLSV
jgi:hypothetical protein